jgi:malate/lactate dehydrogenase
MKGSTAQGIGLTVSGLVTALAHEVGALIPVSVRVGDDVCASLPCILGPEGPSAPLWPRMTDRERVAWEQSLEVLAKANASLPR